MYACLSCSLRFSRDDNLRRHLKHVHQSEVIDSMGTGGDGEGKGGGFNFYTTSQRFLVDQYLVAKHTWLKTYCKTSHMSYIPHHRKLYGCTCKGNHSMTKFTEQLGHKLSLYRVFL